MKCPNCEGLGYLVAMRPMVMGAPNNPPPVCQPCKGTGIVPDPKPVPILAGRLSKARRTRKV
jgi:hypothetical protein